MSDSILTSLVKKAENKVYRAVDTDEEREYATSVLATGNRYVTIPTDLRAIRYVQLADNSTSPAKQVYLEKRDTSFSFFKRLNSISYVDFSFCNSTN